MKATRREMLLWTAALVPTRSVGLTVTSAPETEPQKGDPEAEYESLTYDPDQITAMSSGSGRATFEPHQPDLPARMLTQARTYKDCSRADTPGEIAKLLQLFYLDLRDANKVYVPFCAAGVSSCAISAFAGPKVDAASRVTRYRQLAADVERYYFYPTVSCRDMWNAAKSKRRWVSRAQEPNRRAKPGWIVLFDWAKKGNPDHCGIVQGASASKLFTWEFNTSATVNGNQRDGGAVGAKERSYDYVLGYVVTDGPPPRP